MLDLAMRPIKDAVLNKPAKVLAKYSNAYVISIVSLFCCAGAGVLASNKFVWLSLAAWLVGRVLDGLDGPVARLQGRASDFGGYSDMLGDTIGYFVVPFGVAYAVDQRSTWIAVGVMLGLFSVNTISWTYLSAILEKRGQGAKSNNESTTISMPPALIEGTETVVIYSLFLAMPQYAETIFWLMSTAVCINVVQRFGWAHKSLRE